MRINYSDYQPKQAQRHSQISRILTGISLWAILTGCNTITATQYEATAQTTYTWKVNYYADQTRKQERVETFASTSLMNRNGEKPEDAVIGPDDKELWWPALPPRPTLDQIEQRLQPNEQATKPEILQTVDYQLSYSSGGQTITLPTNYDVYRQVTKSYPSQTPLQLTLGINDASVEKAEPVGN